MARVKNEYIVLGSKIEAERPGEADICMRIDGMDISDDELLNVKEVQRRAAQEIENILNKDFDNKCTEKKQVLTYTNGRPSYEDKEI